MPKTLIIAEAGVNHNGSLDAALALVDKAADTGADAIKFQTFTAESLATSGARKAKYQAQQTDAAESQLDMLRRLQLNESDYLVLAARCAERNIEFMSSPFDLQSVELLLKCKVKRFKIPSGEITNGPLLLKIAASGLPCVLSTGMATIGEVETALAILAYGYTTNNASPENGDFYKRLSRKDFAILTDRVALLHCTSNYPTDFSDVNLRCMDTLRTTFGLTSGYSDHTLGLEIAVAAVARGAEVIEKHFTLSRDQEGPDHQSSLEPGEFGSLVTMIRNVEQALGSPMKYPVDNELDTRSVARKGIVAASKIQAGEKFHPDNLAIKRPEKGLSPLLYWNLLGKTSRRTFELDESIVEE